MQIEQYEEILAQGEADCEQALELSRKGQAELSIPLFEKAVNGFMEIDHQAWLNFTRHEMLAPLHALGRKAEWVPLGRLILEGYRALEDASAMCLLLTYLAHLHQEDQDDDQALEALRLAEAIALSERQAEVMPIIRGNLAVQLLLRERYGDAVTLLLQALDGYQEDARERSWLHEKLGFAYRELYLLKQAEDHYLKALEGYLAHQDQDLAYAVMADLRDFYQQIGKTAEAAALAKKLSP